MNFVPSFSSETWTLLVLFFTLFFTYSIWTFGTFQKLGIPGPRPIPLLGNLLSYRVGIHNFDTDCFKKYGKVWGVYETRKPVMMIADPAMLKTILVKECYSLFTNRRDGPAVGILKDAVSIAKDEKWRRIRNSLSPSFTSGRLKDVFPVVQQYADSLMNNLQKRNLEEPILIKDMLGAYSMDVVTSSSFSVEVDSINNPDDPFVSNMKKLMNFSLFNPVVLLLLIFPFLAPVFEKFGLGFFSAKRLDFFHSTLRKVKDQHEKNDGDRVDFLKLMIQSQISAEQADKYTDEQPVKGLTDQEILSQSFIFILAGYETTSTSLSLLLYNLATHPECMKKLQEEIDDFFPNNAQVTYDALTKMEYLDMAINESMRLWPTAPRVDRVCKKTVEIDGVTIPKDMVVGAAILVMHRDPNLWESPESFRPERFSKENKESINPYAYLPFGAGPRNCIGMRFALLIMKLAVVKILQSFDIETCKETQIPLELNSMYQPKKPITLKFVLRSSAMTEISAA
ncbi:hypothetical protein AGOR_G00228360 [Albula goreensis]|uniref:Cytochrome P450 3A n=1 Tax=Albula goreensis TaxID=1534307 RepID=A0A8T3CLC5_9TELE|nr:hypothetical protein AGOR_G00228360 [Albula goreensis]